MGGVGHTKLTMCWVMAAAEPCVSMVHPAEKLEIEFF